MDNICERCYHNYVCDEYNADRDFPHKVCAYHNSHFIDAADVVEVVRCRECKHLNVINDPKLYAHCPKTNTVFLPFDLDTREHFCSRGQRKIETVLPKSDEKDESLEADHD